MIGARPKIHERHPRVRVASGGQGARRSGPVFDRQRCSLVLPGAPSPRSAVITLGREALGRAQRCEGAGDEVGTFRRVLDLEGMGQAIGAIVDDEAFTCILAANLLVDVGR